MKSVLVFVLLCFFTINYAEGAGTCTFNTKGGSAICEEIVGIDSYSTPFGACTFLGFDLKVNDTICDYIVASGTYTGETLKSVDLPISGEIRPVMCSLLTPCTYIRICAKGYYGYPYSNGCHQCPDGGTTDGTGATQVYNCYKIIEKDTPDGHGRRQEKCYFQMSANGYTNCVAEDGYPKVISCNAGYYAVDSECSPVGKGYYSPDSDTERYQCPTYTKDTSKVNGTTATTTSASIKDCMVPAYIDDVTKETFTDYKGTYFFPNNCEHPGN